MSASNKRLSSENDAEAELRLATELTGRDEAINTLDRGRANRRSSVINPVLELFIGTVVGDLSISERRQLWPFALQLAETSADPELNRQSSYLLLNWAVLDFLPAAAETAAPAARLVLLDWSSPVSDRISAASVAPAVRAFMNALDSSIAREIRQTADAVLRAVLYAPRGSLAVARPGDSGIEAKNGLEVELAATDTVIAIAGAVEFARSAGLIEEARLNQMLLELIDRLLPFSALAAVAPPRL